ncbi:MAG: non-canonical purine NTP pyrophosphatase [Deltaproteobacteria bacterium]|jgi:XTP/dITP diphosphohydrolase|nr:non-canonical purine NTP pyrophosphatase [Deltaproteobacteria bacterium]
MQKNKISSQTKKPKLLLATTNQGKAKEFIDLLGPLQIDVLTLSDLKTRGPTFPEAVENGSSFHENAVIKADHYLKSTRLPTLADDSGLCVWALDGRPGIHSARFGGESISDPERCRKLIALMEQKTDRRAWFETALALKVPASDRVMCWRARLEGVLTYQPLGTNGFGFDCIFVPEGFTRTLAQMTINEKNLLSHRSLAIAEMVKDVEEIKKLLAGCGEEL